MKKKDKDRLITVSKGKNIKNRAIGNIDSFLDEEYSHGKKALYRKQSKNVKTLKSDIDLQEAIIVAIMTNNKFTVVIDNEEFCAILSGRLKQFMFSQRRVLTIGDRVKVDVSSDGAHRIEEVIPRKNKLMRFSEGRTQKEILIAANMDYAAITVSCVQPMLKLGVIDRFIIQCSQFDIEPLVIVNKIDLVDNLSKYQDMLRYYQESGYKVVFVSAESGVGLEELKSILQDKVTVFAGQSGVGKSSLINLLMPSLDLQVGEISDYNEKGRHTTTNSRLIKWDFGGFLVDTPGIKTISLNRNNIDLIYRGFPGFYRYDCHFSDCTHTHEDHCGVKSAVLSGEIPESIYESYLRIIDSI